MNKTEEMLQSLGLEFAINGKWVDGNGLVDIDGKNLMVRSLPSFVDGDALNFNGEAFLPQSNAKRKLLSLLHANITSPVRISSLWLQYVSVLADCVRIEAKDGGRNGLKQWHIHAVTDEQCVNCGADDVLVYVHHAEPLETRMEALRLEILDALMQSDVSHAEAYCELIQGSYDAFLLSLFEKSGHLRSVMNPMDDRMWIPSQMYEKMSETSLKSMLVRVKRGYVPFFPRFVIQNKTEWKILNENLLIMNNFQQEDLERLPMVNHCRLTDVLKVQKSLPPDQTHGFKFVTCFATDGLRQALERLHMIEFLEFERVQ